MSSGTQKGTKAIKPGPTMIRPFLGEQSYYYVFIMKIAEMYIYYYENTDSLKYIRMLPKI